jgi:cytochrome c oxidase accessory protein FixG
MGREIDSALVDDGGAMYVSERKIYPRDVDGRFQKLRALAVFVLLGMYYLFPWLEWNGRQAVLFDLAERKFYVFGLAFWPQDFIFLALGLVLAGLSLFFFTAVAGRLWCGYACPQTVWTECFLWMERITEGDRNKRIKLDAAPWSVDKLRKKGSKHVLWFVFALWTGFTFVGFFTPMRDLALRTWPFEWNGWEIFWVLFYALATWGNAGVLREQVCKYMCPYARFQSAMFDHDTLIITYDEKRGEARGARKKGAQPAEGQGDCIDCTICVQVCPTGIDIRDGLQYECIACGACIDACDEVMDKVGSPRGLIRYATQNSIEGKPTRVVRPRVLIYGTLLVLLMGGIAAGVLMRKPLIVDVMRDQKLYRELASGEIENAYTLRVVNKDAQAHRFELKLDAKAPLQLAGPGLLSAGPEEILTVPVTVRAAPGAVKGGVDLHFQVQDQASGLVVSEKARFFAPVSP